MIPVLAVDATLEPAYVRFLDALRGTGFAGDVACDYATRLSVATDNGVFQQIPQAAVFPRDEQDLARMMRLAGREEHRAVRLAPRGGGTSTIGCSLTAGLVVDCSRHMNRILAIDVPARRVRVQPGVVLDQLNDALAPHGFFFAPNVAPGSRATLGGMAGTDGCGKGSRVYGKTSDHVLATRLVLADGSLHEAAPVAGSALEALCRRDDAVGRIHREVRAVLREQRERIEVVFPRLRRYLTGYNLAQAYDATQDRLDLNKLVCGAEGTLALVAELTLKLTPLPGRKVLFALRYRSFDDALRDAQRLVAFQPHAIESVDDHVMGLARVNPIYERVRDYIEEPDGRTPAAVNLVEFADAPERALDDALAAFEAFLGGGDACGGGGEACRATGFYRADAEPAQKALWDLRKGGVGLLGSMPGRRKPLPFVEDTVVDPALLADYVRDFRAILDRHGLAYGMFGHIDVGCLHVRPALDLCDPDDERLLREVMDEVEALVRRYGGLIWNEHGKGFRSQYNPDCFGPELYDALRRVKRAFDPHNQLNPGKIVAFDDGPPLASMDAPKRGSFDRQIPLAAREAHAAAIACNGNGACFGYDPRELMCPSYRASRDRLHSPKGRAALMREWLRQLGLRQAWPPQASPPRVRGPWRRALADAWRRLRPATRAGDFSHEVWQAMDGCLSCRACASQCPVKVDVPDFKTRFLALYHTRYPRPWSDHAVAALEHAVPLAARVPWLYRASVRLGAPRWLGLGDAPALSRPGLAPFLRRHPDYLFSHERYDALDAARRRRCVFLVQDVFTSFFDAELVIDVVRLVERLGYHPLLLPYAPSGKPLQVKGYADEFARTARQQAQRLTEVARLGPPLVGIEPSVTLAYREPSYAAALGQASMPFEVLLLEEWLAARLEHGGVCDGASYTLFQHCTPAANLPASARAWTRVFRAFGLSLVQAQVGCCGMSGAYGHETRHLDTSRTIFALSWDAAMAALPHGALVVPGYSCRAQIRRLCGIDVPHPAQVLLRQWGTRAPA